jgi:hypothetical protein
MQGFIVVKRPLEIVENSRPAPGLTDEVILSRYRGFGGEIWPQRDGLSLPFEDDLAEAVVSSYNVAKKYLSALTPRELVDILYVSDEDVSDDDHISPAAQLVFLGFDYGYIQSPYNCYSSLYFECLYGACPDLKKFAAELNKCLLFSDTALISSFAQVRAELQNMGAPLESYEIDEEFRPIAVWG